MYPIYSHKSTTFLRIKKVDLVAKRSLRVFATFTEATHPEGALLLEDGLGGVWVGTKKATTFLLWLTSSRRKLISF
jgi:hypothetical protein